MRSEATLFVVDDDPAVRDSLTQVATRMQLAAECFPTADEFLCAFDSSRPGCLVLDIRMPGMDGIELQAKLVEDGIQIPVIIITGHGDVPLGVRAMKQGAVDFLEKPFQPKQLTECIRKALSLDARRRDKRYRQDRAESRLRRLTRQEREVMGRIVAGKPNKVIATELEVSLRTVQYRRASIMEKMEVESKAALIEAVISAEATASERAKTS